MSLIARELNLQEAHSNWVQAESYLYEAIDDEDPKDFLRSLKSRVFSGLDSLWVIEEFGVPLGYVVTTVYTPDGLLKIGQIHIGAASQIDKLIDSFDIYESWAIGKGITHIEIVGRKGWEKRFKKQGFRHNYTSLMKCIDKELH